MSVSAISLTAKNAASLGSSEGKEEAVVDLDTDELGIDRMQGQVNNTIHPLSRQELAERLTKLLSRSEQVNDPSLQPEMEVLWRQCREAFQNIDQTTQMPGPQC
jgi:hypothetical protein